MKVLRYTIMNAMKKSQLLHLYMYYNLHKFIRLRLHYYVCSPENVCWVWKGIENKTKESEYDEREAFFRFGPVADYLVLYGQRFFVGGVSWEES